MVVWSLLMSSGWNLEEAKVTDLLSWICNFVTCCTQTPRRTHAMFMASDSTTNLHTALDMYREQVKELQGMELGLVTSNAHHTPLHILILVGGRLCSSCLVITNFSLGYMGCLVQAVILILTQLIITHMNAYLGRHNCLWCEIDSADLKKPLSSRGPSQPRNLENLQANHQDFLQKSKGDLKKAKQHYECHWWCTVRYPSDNCKAIHTIFKPGIKLCLLGVYTWSPYLLRHLR